MADPVDRKRIAAWCLYDWANSAFTTLVVTFVYSTYFSQALAPDVINGTILWSRAVGTSALLVALLSPVLGHIADCAGRRCRALAVATISCVAATALLALVSPAQAGAIPLALGLFILANTAYELGYVFYNAFLPDLAPRGRIGAISGYGWGAGYLGGIACLLLALAVLVREDPLWGIATEAGFNIRATNLLVAVWFLLFSLPLLGLCRDRPDPSFRFSGAAFAATLRHTWRDLADYPELRRFLLAHLVYNDGLVTIFAFGGIYAAGTFGMSMHEVLVFGVALNVVAGIGSFLFGHLDDSLGGRRAILLSLVGLILAVVMAAVAGSRAWFWLAGLAIGLFVGPNQSASRSLLGRFAPSGQQAEFYGFFSLSGKLTSFAGPLLLGAVTGFTGSQRVGVATLLLFFIVGGLLLWGVDETQGMARATRQNGAGAGG
ncbi:MAG: MFS transporter [Thermodesulfobacteriota bacterium]